MSVTIRTRTEADLPGAVAALHAVHEADNYPTAWPADPAAWLTPDDLLGSWVAEHEHAIVGGVGLLAGRTEPDLATATGLPADDLAVVTRLYVSPAARGLGLARQLVGTVVDRAANLGLRVGLDVMDDSTAARALYESLGWTHHGTARARWTTQRGDHPRIHFYLAP